MFIFKVKDTANAHMVLRRAVNNILFPRIISECTSKSHVLLCTSYVLLEWHS